MNIGYLISSHVVQNHAILPPLLASLLACGIDPERILVSVSGAITPRVQIVRGVHFIFNTQEFTCYFQPTVEGQFGRRMGVTHWFFINGTSRAGPQFADLVEAGADPEADVTLAGSVLPLGSRGTGGRAINDLALYRDDYLHSQIEAIRETSQRKNEPNGAQWDISEGEGMLYALAPKKAAYPVTTREDRPEEDIYGTGTMRRVEYYPGIDWYRFKRNYGQLWPGSYDPVMF